MRIKGIKVDMKKQVVIKRSWVGNMLFAISCLMVVMVGLFILEEAKLIGVVCILFFGVGGLYGIVFVAWKPLVIISIDGIAVPNRRGITFVEWSNVKKIEIIKHKIPNATQTYIGIFVFDNNILGNFAQNMTTMLTGWDEAPALLINNTFSFVRYEKIMAALEEFYDEYRKSQLSESGLPYGEVNELPNGAINTVTELENKQD